MGGHAAGEALVLLSAPVNTSSFFCLLYVISFGFFSFTQVSLNPLFVALRPIKPRTRRLFQTSLRSEQQRVEAVLLTFIGFLCFLFLRCLYIQTEPAVLLPTPTHVSEDRNRSFFIPANILMSEVCNLWLFG